MPIQHHRNPECPECHDYSPEDGYCCICDPMQCLYENYREVSWALSLGACGCDQCVAAQMAVLDEQRVDICDVVCMFSGCPDIMTAFVDAAFAGGSHPAAGHLRETMLRELGVAA